MSWQWAVAAALVVVSAIYAGWTLMPSSLRSVLATTMLGLPLPGRIAARLRVHAARASSCACSGCDRNPSAADAGAASPAAQPITLHRRMSG